jgi:putative zinc finger/helix-turn-helix YgiT family protein
MYQLMKNKGVVKETDFEVAIPNAERTAIVERITIRVPVEYDVATGEELLTPEALDLIEDTQARYMGLLLPAEIRALRKSLGLTQREFGNLLQVGEKTATRWETGRGRPSRSLNVLLCALRDKQLPTWYLKRLQKSTETPEAAADHQDLALAA